MVKPIVFVLSLLIFFSCSRSAEKQKEKQVQVRLEKLGIISLETERNFPSSFDIVNWGDDGKAIVGIDRRINEILFFDFNGQQMGKVKVPTIDQPFGLKRISDVHYINRDSILVYDAQYLRLILQNQESEVIDSWHLPDFWSEASRSGNVGIVDAYLHKGSLIAELLAFENLYPISSRQFYEESKFFHFVNLTQETVNSYLNYPEESPYRSQLFYTAFFPYVVKTSTSYVLSFPFDNGIYSFNKGLSSYTYLQNEPKAFPRATGQAFGSHQTGNDVLYSRKLNGFGLFMRNSLEVNGLGECVIRVYREALGNKDEIPNDSRSFYSDEFPPTYNLELFKVDGQRIIKIGQEISLKDLGISNFVGQDDDGVLLFIEHNPDREDPRLVKIALSVN